MVESAHSDNPIFDSDDSVVVRRSPPPGNDVVSIGILAYGSDIFEEEEYYGDERPREIAKELQYRTGASDVRIKHIDPSIGAGANGLQLVIDFFVENPGTWIWAVNHSRAVIDKVVKHMRSLSPPKSRPVEVAFPANTLQTLVLADVCSRHGVDPTTVHHPRCLSHEIDPPGGEDRPELRALNSVHTITVEAAREDGYHHVWIYHVSPHGIVVEESHVRVPIPFLTDWGYLDPRRVRSLVSAPVNG